ncbi:hypothetical protein N7G274_000461 [Stereocaulon virgatum]|uniref:Uncharacterized protein n=1 Tax=Stereocaulon virgatum TaxID=373712 RepID=A0ABR4ASN3_9LECA
MNAESRPLDFTDCRHTKGSSARSSTPKPSSNQDDYTLSVHRCLHHISRRSPSTPPLPFSGISFLTDLLRNTYHIHGKRTSTNPYLSPQHLLANPTSVVPVTMCTGREISKSR